ncbi:MULTISPECIES: DUF167 domain-containing protein [unclassified Novosphingobium]|uniref:DUF167 domain-containing protein n=1 Tax=unclassified Novosphingobium TaxID=2644732 RepID=UPI000869D36E|nr:MULTISPECIES: DUF167 domain-containing protein [unclassified Novosphingobium]MBN9142653.1 DUF167 domain-containing protein [Novosphingobium sp.]MDR6705736.1 uncharacterized protein YggU (UPF0235/DUF167 family) [Novosphingobium sp. 1748]ODU80394.1 MAG: hypothetical protein ABT10_17765 [Novosphingobium sp. SCN 63-17]OJX89064.1 MAG: hypothetical protein BGP00_12380 [Novosphingobium sp. 63-713]
MARPKLALPAPEAIRALVDGEGRLAVKVTPGARSKGVEIVEGRLLVKVRAKPEDGKATEAVIELVAQALGIGSSRVTLLRGATSREKLLSIAA